MKLAQLSTTEQVERAIKKYVHQVPGPAYRSGAGIVSFPSSGFSYRIASTKVGRQLIAYSKSEYQLELRADWDDYVTDIQDQFLILPFEESIIEAARLKVRHPQVRGVIRPVSVDMVLSTRDGRLFAIEAKASPKFFTGPKTKKRQQRIDLQAACCRRKGYEFVLAFGSTLDYEVTKNLRLLKYHVLHARQGTSALATRIATDYLPRRANSNASLSTLVDRCSSKFGRHEKVILGAIYFAIWRQLLRVDLRAPLRLDSPLRWTDHPSMWVELPWSR